MKKDNIKSNEGKDLTEGKLLKNMLLLFFPLLLTNLLNSIYNFVDAIWIGNIVGESGISVSTNVYPILFIVTAVGYSLSTATSVLISQLYGAKEKNKIKQVVKVSLLTTFIIVFCFNLLMGLVSNIWLKVINTPTEVLKETREYFIIYLIAYFFNFILMNIMESLRAIGNTKTPIVFVGITTTLNIVLDPILLNTSLGINGAAIATLIAIGIGLLVACIYINTRTELLKWDFNNIKFDKDLFFKYIKVAIPILLQECFIGIILLSEVKVSNETGIEGSSSYGVVGKLEQIVWIVASSFGTMISVFTGQFVGKKEYDRVKDVVKNGVKMALVPMILVGILVYFFPYQLCRIFLSNEIIIKSAIGFLHIMGFPFIMTTFRNIFRGWIRGSGHTKVLLMASIISGLIELSLIRILTIVGLNNLSVLGFSIIGYLTVETTILISYYFSNKWKKSII